MNLEDFRKLKKEAGLRVKLPTRDIHVNVMCLEVEASSSRLGATAGAREFWHREQICCGIQFVDPVVQNSWCFCHLPCQTLEGLHWHGIIDGTLPHRLKRPLLLQMKCPLHVSQVMLESSAQQRGFDF